MRILFSGYHNPHFKTVTEYAETAFAEADVDLRTFDDRSFFVPGRVRQRLPFLENLDLRALNWRLVRKAADDKPEIFFALGGHRILPSTLTTLRDMGVMTVLWTADAPSGNFDLLIKAAPYYDRIFCAGTEAIELFRRAGINNARWLPFACAPDEHKKQELSEAEKKHLECDICFVGTVDQGVYPFRIKILESICDMDLKIWGPGVETLSESSPLRRKIQGEKTPPDLWTKIYSAAKIVLCIHYSDPSGKYPCYQASPRVYEAMACGGFLMCDAQNDVLSLFDDGRHLVVFRDAGDLREKITHYLTNPIERENIAQAGRQEVTSKHTYRKRIDEILDSVRKNEKFAD